jgi:hypothetical protein
MQLEYKQDWADVKSNFTAWWEGRGLVLDVRAPRRKSLVPVAEPVTPDDAERLFTDPVYRVARAEYELANTYFGGDAYPVFEPLIGPGSLGTFLGARPVFSKETVWYESCISDPDKFGPISFEPEGNHWWKVHLDIVRAGLERAAGRYLVAMPDLIENMDTLAAMRGTEELLMDIVERPEWIHARLAEINEAFFKAFDAIYSEIKDDEDGNSFCFRIWGPGKTCKVQCDFSCMISPQMFREFVTPYLTAQCEWLDYPMYHLDGTNAMQHLDNLLAIEPLKAIEWTPQAGRPGGGSPEWYELYRRIKAGGKSVQAIGVNVDEVIPLLDAVGPEGMYLMVNAPDQESAEKLLSSVGREV